MIKLSIYVLIIILFLMLVLQLGIFITCLYILKNIKKDKNKRRLVE